MTMHTANRRRISLAFVATAVAASLLLQAPAASASEPYPSDGDHPLRIAHYFVAPVGRLLEMTVTRPLFAIGSRVAPHDHINKKGFQGCSRERPARSCTKVVR